MEERNKETVVQETAEQAVPEKVETMDDYKDMLEASFRRINTGDVMTGKVISVTDEEVLVDLDYFAPGVITLANASDDPSYTFAGNIEEGQTVSGTVVRRDDGAGRIELSMKEAAALAAWDRLRELKDTQDNVTVRVTDVTRGGAVAYLEGVRGFIPASKLALSYIEEEGLKEYVNKSIDVRVIDADEETKHLVMSARDILWEKKQEEREAKIKAVQVGAVVEGTVETIKPYGAFVSLGEGLSGLLHISRISYKRLKTPNEVLKEGQKVTVKIVGNKDGKLSLSMRDLEDAPVEETVEETFELPETEEIGTSLGSLFKNLKL